MFPEDQNASLLRQRQPLSKRQVLAYGVGHVLNDMCASCWFSYLLVFLKEVVHMSPVQSAIVMFCGQIADGVATPLVGVLSDKSKGIPSIGFGRRKTWLFFGAILVFVCYSMVFATCVPGWFSPNPSNTVILVYYSFAASVFNIGWATVQVSHMALVPELTSDDNLRCVLNSTRYAFTILSNVLVFCSFLLFLHEVNPPNVTDAFKFRLLAYTSLIVGGGTVVWFLIGTKEKLSNTQSESCSNALTSGLSPSMEDVKVRGPNAPPFESNLDSVEYVHHVHMAWYDWFKVKMFYEVGLVYMCTRLVVNISQVYFSFFLMITLNMSATSIAIVPLLVYLAGFFATFFMRSMNEKIGRHWSYTIGGTLILLSLSLSYSLTPVTADWIYFFSMILGVGNSIIMVTSVCMEGDLVGDHVESGAFVYGAMSFTDKVSNGIAVVFIQNGREAIQNLYPGDTSHDGDFVRSVFCLVPSVAVILGVCVVLIMHCCQKKANRELPFDDESKKLVDALIE